MNIEEFKQSITTGQIPDSLSLYLQSLWYDAAGDWQQAHDLVDQRSDQLSARIHAYLHRKEGDQSNADYWYRQSREPKPSVSLDEEWEALVTQLLDL